MLQFAAPYLAIIVVGYVLKDRIKEWGKRYLQPLAGWFGVDFPDRRVRVRTPACHCHCMAACWLLRLLQVCRLGMQCVGCLLQCCHVLRANSVQAVDAAFAEGML